MLDTTAVAVTIPGQETARIGPFIASTNAERYAERLRDIARRRRVDAQIEVMPANPDLEHLDPRLPTEPWALERLIADEEDDTDDGRPPFPGINDRLSAQIGDDNAEQIWERATGWSGPHDDEARRTELMERAEDWRTRRDQSTTALQRIAVQLWLAGLQNIRQIHAITGLARASIYAALRQDGIEPTSDRSITVAEAHTDLADAAQGATAAVANFARADRTTARRARSAD